MLTLVAVAVAVGGFILLARSSARDPIVQLTSDGRAKDEPVFSDGHSIFFQEQIRDTYVPASVPIKGGLSRSIEVPGLSRVILFDWSDSTQRFLLSGQRADGAMGLWSWQPLSTPEELVSEDYAYAVWLEGANFAAVHSSSTKVEIHSNGQLTRHLQVPAMPEFHDGNPPRVGAIAWSAPRHALRVAVHNFEQNTATIWEASLPDGVLRLLPEFEPDACCVFWSKDGREFFFRRSEKTSLNYWYTRTNWPALWEHPTKISSAPIDVTHATVGPGNKNLLAIGLYFSAELVEYDAQARRFMPFLGGLKGLEVDYSPDSQWITYVTYPERVLHVARANGTEARPLTKPPLRALQPHWSPDGKQIAFMGGGSDEHRHVYMVGADGTDFRQVTDSKSDQGIPTWSPDGRSIVYGDLLYRSDAKKMVVHKWICLPETSRCYWSGPHF